MHTEAKYIIFGLRIYKINIVCIKIYGRDFLGDYYYPIAEHILYGNATAAHIIDATIELSILVKTVFFFLY